MVFHDRRAAGRALAAELASYVHRDAVVLALPRGGVPVAAEVAAALGAPLGVLVVRKIGVPDQPELAMGAVVATEPPIVVRNEAVMAMAHVSDAEFAAVLDSELEVARERVRQYAGHREQPPIAKRTVILVDDGAATGATMRAAIRAVRTRRPKAIVVALPVASPSTLEELRTEADDVVCVEAHHDLSAVGLYYSDFAQVSDRAVIEALAGRATLETK